MRIFKSYFPLAEYYHVFELVFNFSGTSGKLAEYERPDKHTLENPDIRNSQGVFPKLLVRRTHHLVKSQGVSQSGASVAGGNESQQPSGGHSCRLATAGSTL